jgi:hypothetical protein
MNEKKKDVFSVLIKSLQRHYIPQDTKVNLEIEPVSTIFIPNHAFVVASFWNLRVNDRSVLIS